MKKISFIFLLALLSLAASAEVVEYKGLWYNFNTEDNTAEVVASQSAPYSGDITIPASSYYQNKSYSVTSIGESAFEGCTGLTDVIIPSSVRTIEKGAFYECSGLTSVKIPNGVTKIGLGAFSVCTNLTCIIIPGSVTDIESYAFDYCTSLNHIVSESEQPAPFNNTVFDTHDDSYDVYTMATLVIPNGANSIYQSTAGWNNFSHVSEASEQKTRTIHIAKAGTLPNFISDMEKYLIEELSLSGDLNGTDIRFIRNMSGVDFDEIWHDEAESYRTQGILKALDLSNAHIVSGGDYIYAYGNGDYAAYFRTKNNTISTCMFYGVKLTSIVLPQSITCIESGAFHYVPTSASSYGRTNEFGRPVSLTIPSSVTSIGNGVFSGCTNLTNLIVVDGNVSYDSREGCNAIIEKTSNTLITGCKNTIIPNSVISIGQDAFRDCYGLTSVTIPNSVTSIGEFAFYGCSGLTSVHISDLVAWCNIKFNSNPLSNAHHLYIDGKEITNLVIPNSVTSIGSLAFSSCSSLTSVTIPNSVTSIGNYAFSGCSNLTTIISETEDPFGIGDKVFNSSDKDIYSTATLIVPSGKKATYQMTEGWKKFTNIVEIGEGGLIGQVFEAGGIFYKIQDNGANVTVVRGGTRYYKGDIIIPDIVNYNGKDYSVTSIGVEAFDDCNGMTSISIPSSISSIEIMAFQDCTRLSSVHITDLDAWCNISFGRSDSNPLSTAGHLYLNGEEIKDLVIPNGITSIKKASFYGCKGLTSVKIPNSVTSIGNYAFYGCTGLTSVTIGNSVTSID